MNWRTTVVLLAVAAVVVVVAWINPFTSEEEESERSPWFYQVALEDIETLAIRSTGGSVSFYKTEVGSWAFDDPEGIPPNYTRWGGVTLLVSGPGTNRDLTQYQPIIDDPAEYGLDDPGTVVNVGLSGDRELEFRLGDKTTDGGHHYGQVIGFDDLFLIAGTWGDVVARLANEPPLPKWYVKRDPAQIVELNVFLGDASLGETPRLEFHQENDGQWTVKNTTVDEERIPVDPERWESIRPLMPGPTRPIGVAVPRVDDGDYAPWGVVDDSKAFEIRFSGTTDSGTRFVDGVLLKLGDKTPDGDNYYAKNESGIVRQPVLLLEAEWVDTILGLFEDPPYSPDYEPPADSTS